MELEKTYVKPVYEEISNHFSNTRHYKWPWITSFIESLPKQSLIYDICCGNGRNMNYSDYNFIGIDNCEGFVDICNKKGLNCINGDMCYLPFKNNSCEALINIAGFHHLDTVERRIIALKEAKRVCKDNGKILISVWSKNQPEKTKRQFEKYGDNLVDYNKNGKVFKRYYYIFKIDEIKNLFNDTGLKIIQHNWNCGNEIFILSK